MKFSAFYYSIAHPPLGLADATRILEIERIRQLKPEELEKRFGTIVGQTNNTTTAFPLHEALWACQNLFITCSKSFGIKHIFLFTDDPDPVNRNVNLKVSSWSRVCV
ncbi:unnamed protein product [Trichobilharzia regenti]|nr:unnamed protein product [Trichobilharzia regenti]